jgi:hypothetical protein
MNDPEIIVYPPVTGEVQRPVAVKWVVKYQLVHKVRTLVGNYGLVYGFKEPR